MNLRIEATSGSKVPFEHVTAALEKALGRLAIQPMSARATFTDVNGPKKGVDIACTVLVTVPSRPTLRVTRRATSARLAFDACLDVAVRRLEETFDRAEAIRRRPKKYYAAKRMLG